jgi:hypothetical protein
MSTEDQESSAEDEERVVVSPIAQEIDRFEKNTDSLIVTVILPPRRRI